MGKKYLETKKDSLESSVLGVWKTAIEEGEAIRGAAQMTKEVTKEEVEIDEGYLELTFKSKQDAEKAYNKIYNEIWASGNPPYDDIAQEGNEIQIDTDGNLNRRNQMLKDLKSGGIRNFKVTANESVDKEAELAEALPSHLKKHFDKDGNPKSKEGKAAWERIKKIKMKGYTPKQVKMAIGVAFDKRFVQGNMTGAAKTIEKIAKGLSDFEPVANALRRANENTILDRIDRKLKERKNG